MTTESDRELLEAAARAAGVPIVPCTCSYERWPFKHDEAKSGKRGHWNPLVDDGDALRLACKLRIEVIPDMAHWGPVTYTNYPNKLGLNGPSETHGTDAMAATRRAIVRAAAAIGAHKEQA